jgi:NDP-sugar pyrophosphorylase family protein
LQFDFREFHCFHREHGGLASIAVRSVPDASRYGTVHLDRGNRVIGFSEKMGIQESGLINGGVYLFQRAILEHIPEGPASLEKDVLPGILENGLSPSSSMECLLISERPRTMRAPKLFSTAFLTRLFSTLKPGPRRGDAPSPEWRK